jgi:putative transcriptional regulator
MNKNTTTVRLGHDGTLVRVRADGREEKLGAKLISPMTANRLDAGVVEDRDNQPFTLAQLKEMRRVPRVKTLRRALGLTQEEFAGRYQIPLGTLRDWEQERTEPDQAARAYLSVIAHDPKTVQSALRAAESGRVSSTIKKAGSSLQDVKARGRVGGR